MVLGKHLVTASNLVSKSLRLSNTASPALYTANFQRHSFVIPQVSPFHSSALQLQKRKKFLAGNSHAFLSRRWNSLRRIIRWPTRRSAKVASLRRPWRYFYKRNRTMSYYGSSSDEVGMKAKAAFATFRSRATNYMNTIATKNANNSYGREISRLISAGSVASTNGPPGSNFIPQHGPPSDDEILVVYPSYSRQTDDGNFEVDVRGWLYLPGQPNRKSKMVLATAKKIAGVKSTGYYTRPTEINNAPTRQSSSAPTNNLISLSDEEDEDIKDLKQEYDVSQSKPPPPPSRSSTLVSTFSTATSQSQEDVLQTRLAPFFSRPVAFRTVKITFRGLTDNHDEEVKVFEAETNSSGRFSTRIKLDQKPFIVSVEAHERLSNDEEVIHVEPEGISVISDIDDTIKNTGILGNKRELFRNVFVRNYDKISIEGVQPWYHQLKEMGATFHYVSNSPWQLYPTIEEFLQSSRFPRGSMHLKEYYGLLNGLFEPASEKKKMNLNGILKDFPKRKFILIGDSGEGDLEAYIELAKRYPTQILAIYIRDVTLPPGEKSPLVVARQPSRANPARTDSPTSLMDEALAPPPPPKSRAFSTPLVSPSASSVSLQSAPAKPSSCSGRTPPPVPPKPPKLSMKKAQEEAPPPLPPRPSASQPISDPSYVGGFAPPPPLPRRTGVASSTNSPRTASPRSGSPLPTSRPVILPSSQDDYEFNDILDKRVESWKYRICYARSTLSEEIHLSTWREGQDVRAESIELLQQHKN